MALRFGATDADDRVRLPSFGHNENAFTWLLWSHKTGTSTFKRFLAKGGNDEKTLLTYSAGDDISLVVKRATTNAQALSVSGVAPGDSAWTFWAVTYDGTDGPRIFKGTLTSEPAEVSYSSRVVGAGAELDDSAEPWTLGNDSATTFGAAFEGKHGVAGHYRRRMTLAEIKRYWRRPIADADCDVFMLLGVNGTSSVPNWSLLGAGQNGTPVGVAASDYVPLGPLFGFDRVSTYVPTAGSTPKSGSDSGAAADASSLVVSLTTADSGAGTESAVLDVTHLRTETASGTEVSALVVSITLTETGAGADAGSAADQGMTFAVVDAGTGSDSATVSVALTGNDAGSGLDSSTLAVALSLAEAAVGSDAATLAAALSTGELGSGAEGVAVLGAAVLGSDAATAAETTSLLAALVTAESGSAVDSGSSGQVVDSERNVTDVGVGSDTAVVAVSLAAADSSSGQDCRSGAAYIRMRR